MKIVQNYLGSLADMYPDGVLCLGGYSDTALEKMYRYRYNPGKFQDAIKLRYHEGKPDNVVGKLSAGDLLELSQGEAYTGLDGNYDDSVGVTLLLDRSKGHAYGFVHLVTQPSCMGVVGVYLSKTKSSMDDIIGGIKSKRLWWKIFRMI